MKILLIDDDPDMLVMVAVGLRRRWPSVSILTATTGDKGLALFRAERPDLVVTDLSMPGTDGFQVVQEIRRQTGDVPLIVVTGRSDDIDELRGFLLGADDYLIKPFGSTVLPARINALLRRSGRMDIAAGAEALAAGDLHIDTANRQVRMGESLVALTPREYSLLHHLARDAGRMIPHAELLESIWGSTWRATASDLKSLVSRLRAKIGDNAQQPVYIFTERGLGYRFIRPDRIAPRGSDDSVG